MLIDRNSDFFVKPCLTSEISPRAIYVGKAAECHSGVSLFAFFLVWWANRRYSVARGLEDRKKEYKKRRIHQRVSNGFHSNAAGCEDPSATQGVVFRSIPFFNISVKHSPSDAKTPCSIVEIEG